MEVPFLLVLVSWKVVVFDDDDEDEEEDEEEEEEEPEPGTTGAAGFELEFEEEEEPEPGTTGAARFEPEFEDEDPLPVEGTVPPLTGGAGEGVATEPVTWTKLRGTVTVTAEGPPVAAHAVHGRTVVVTGIVGGDGGTGKTVFPGPAARVEREPAVRVQPHWAMVVVRVTVVRPVGQTSTYVVTTVVTAALPPMP